MLCHHCNTVQFCLYNPVRLKSMRRCSECGSRMPESVACKPPISRDGPGTLVGMSLKVLNLIYFKLNIIK